MSHGAHTFWLSFSLHCTLTAKSKREMRCWHDCLSSPPQIQLHRRLKCLSSTERRQETGIKANSFCILYILLRLTIIQDTKWKIAGNRAEGTRIVSLRGCDLLCSEATNRRSSSDRQFVTSAGWNWSRVKIGPSENKSVSNTTRSDPSGL